MNSLESPDSHHLRAAMGWLELGNHLEANEELEKITATLRSHPDVLEVRWAIYYAAKKFDICFDIGAALVLTAPDRPSGWRHRSASLHYMMRTREAYDLLFPALKKFPKDWTIHYDMACYACQLGNNDAAWKWLQTAIDLGDAKQVKFSALNDPDFEPFWAKIGEI